ncbi:hypothetical protein V1291_001949 [Nitrobacteraceae bacterium AZCC 1564]
MKAPLVIVSVSLTLAITVITLFLIMMQTRRQPNPIAPPTSRLKIERTTDAPRVSSLIP